MGSIVDEAAAVSLNKAGVVTSEEAVTAKTTAEKDAASNLEVALTAQKEAEAALQTASDDWAIFSHACKKPPTSPTWRTPSEWTLKRELSKILVVSVTKKRRSQLLSK